MVWSEKVIVASTLTRSSELLPDTSLYKYRLSRRIGRGNFGEVWLAIDQAVGQQYAIKVLDATSSTKEEFREAYIGHQLKHDNLVRVHSADTAKHGQRHLVILAMDYIESGSVSNLVNPSNYLELPEAIRICCDVLRGLEYLHSKNLIHNDVKPGNVLIGPQGRGMLSDYGIAGISDNAFPTLASGVYKVHAAPEVLQDNTISVRSDIYQAGLTLFRMLTDIDGLPTMFEEIGELSYYDAISSSKLINKNDFPVFVPRQLRQIIRKATHINQERRYSSAVEMRNALEKLNYPGYWTVTEDGHFRGFNGQYVYRYEQLALMDGLIDVNAYKKKTSTGRETRVTKFCHKKLPEAKANAKSQNFVSAVVEGSL